MLVQQEHLVLVRLERLVLVRLERLVLVQLVRRQLVQLVLEPALLGSKSLSWLLRSLLTPQPFAGRVQAEARDTCSRRLESSRARSG